MSAPIVHRISTKRAWIAFTAAACCLMIYVLACVVSPPAWSPDSSRIALLVSLPGERPDHFALFTYDMAADTRVLLDESRVDDTGSTPSGLLSAPAWSPDGRWIAYYRVKPVAEETAPSGDDVAEPNQLHDPGTAPDGPGGDREVAAPLFSEDNLMLPSFLPDVLKKELAGTDKTETFDAQLTIVSPDGQDKRVLGTMQWIGDDGLLEVIPYMRPVWSGDSKRLLYVRGLEGLLYVGSLELATGKTSAHLFSSVGTPILSRDGRWVASYLDEDNMLVAARMDGSLSTYIRPDFEIEQDRLWFSDGIFWSGDSRRLFVVAEDTALYAVDVAMGTTEKWIVPEANCVNARYSQSAAGDRLYFISGRKDEGQTSESQKLTLRYVHLQDRTAGSLFEFESSFLELTENRPGMFSISPDGRTVLIRDIVDDELGQERARLTICSGKTKKVIMTDRWLFEPLYGDADLILDDSLLGDWSGEDGRISIARGARPKTYETIWGEEEEKHRAAAHLVRLKGATFLALYLDESPGEKEGGPGSRFLPDGFVRVVQAEPKLILQHVEYKELENVLKKVADTIGPEDLGDGSRMEFERVRR